jgi:hypothetical protein
MGVLERAKDQGMLLARMGGAKKKGGILEGDKRESW